MIQSSLRVLKVGEEGQMKTANSILPKGPQLILSNKVFDL